MDTVLQPGRSDSPQHTHGQHKEGRKNPSHKTGVPHFPILKESTPRKGFLEHEQYVKLRNELPERLRPVLAVGYYIGMRLSEMLGLCWSTVNLASGEIRLEAGTTKNDEPRTVPITGEVLQMLRGERERNPEATFVFTYRGRRVQSFYKTWRSAAEHAGLPGLLYHDLRRSGVRNLVRAGVPERVAQSISGHKTRAVFERYNIVSGRDLRDAASKLETYLASQNAAQNEQSSSKECTDSGAVEKDAQSQTSMLQ